MNADVKQTEPPFGGGAGDQEMPSTSNKARKQKYRAALDYSDEIREYFDLVVRHVLKGRTSRPSLEICDPQDMHYSGLCDTSDDTIYFRNGRLFEPLVHHELAHYVYVHHSSHGFLKQEYCGKHDVIFACTSAAFHLFVKRDTAHVPKRWAGLPNRDGLTYMSHYDVWEETEAPLKESYGLLFVRAFYDHLRYNYIKEDEKPIFIGDIPAIAAHARVIYLGSLTLNDMGYVDTDNGNVKKMREAVQRAFEQWKLVPPVQWASSIGE